MTDSVHARYIATFLPITRRRSIAAGIPLPEEASGVCLFADISGFTPLTEALGKSLGPTQGAEVLTDIINQVFKAIIPQVYAWGGDVLGFAGDAITCFFTDPPGEPGGAILPAVCCAYEMQAEMAGCSSASTPDGSVHTLSMKVGLAHGPVRRWLVGAPDLGRFDLLAGTAVQRMAEAEHYARQGEIIVSPEIYAWAAARAADRVTWGEDRQGFHVLLSLVGPFAGQRSPIEAPELAIDALQPYFPPALFEWLSSTGENFQAELRPVVSVFLRFEGLDFENDSQVHQKLNRYVSTIQAVAASYGGMLARLDYGDKGSVMHVLFGSPHAHEDDELRAVGWALDVQSAVHELPFATTLQIGMTRGQVYAGALGVSLRRSYTLMGDEVNASARLMIACQPGQILTSQKIMQAAQKRFIFHQFPGFMVKGKYEPIPVGMPVAALPQMPQMTAAGPLVGREVELEQLEKLLDNLVVTGAGRVLRIHAATGMGKSRLCAEMAQRAILRGVRTLVSTAPSTGQVTPYVAWREVLHTLFGLQAAWPAMQQSMQIQTMLQWINPEWLPRLPLLGDLLGLQIPETPLTASLDAQVRQQSLFALFGDLLTCMAAQQPLLILIEDCHWIDGASAALFESLAQSLFQAPVRIILIATHRPPDDPSQPILPTLDSLPVYTGIELGELPEPAMRSLVTAHLGGELAPALMDAILRRASGNPFFIEELAESLRESSHLQMVEGRWRLVTQVNEDSLSVPESIQGIVLARLDLLDEHSKQTLKVSSVAGSSFQVEIVANIHPDQPGPETLQSQLTTLEKRDFLQQEPSETEPTCRFKHTLLQEVAYSTLLYTQRRALHRAAARWYENTRRQVLSSCYQLLVHHYHVSGDAGQELHYLRLAAQQAYKCYANHEAVQLTRRILELTPAADISERFEALALREEVCARLADRSQQQADLAEMSTLAEALDARQQNNACRYQVTRRQAYYLLGTGEYAAALASTQTSLSLAVEDADVARAYIGMGHVLKLMGNSDEARVQLEKALSLAHQAGDPILQANCLLDMAESLRLQDRYTEALAYYKQALELYQQTGDRHSEGICRMDIGLVENCLGLSSEARAYLEQAQAIAAQVGDRLIESMILNNLGLWTYYQGDLAGADALYGQALRLCRAINNRADEAMLLNNLGWNAMILGNYPASQQYYQQSLHLARRLGDRFTEAAVLSSQGLLLYQIGDQPAALDASQQALEIARPAGFTSLCAEALTHQGHALAESGQLNQAAAAYQQAYALYQQIERSDNALEALSGLARLHLAQGHMAQAINLVEQILPGLYPGLVDNVEEGFRVYLTCCQVLQTAADSRAAELFATAKRDLHERAARINDLALRESYLNNVPAHKALQKGLRDLPVV
ncbi:MAG: tetratricopeptide repeat protein [Chloroflexota bacterium]